MSTTYRKPLKQITLIGIDGAGNETNQMDSVLMWCMKHFDFGSVLHVSGGGVSCNYTNINRIGVPRMSVADYNRFCVYRLSDLVTTDFCMIVHTDGFILNPHLWDDRFLNYDYVGAPWYRSYTTYSEGIVGNGGFCIRSKKFLDYSKRFVGYDGSTNEDLFLCAVNYRKSLEEGLKIADLETAARFSIETLSDRFPSIANSFGFHGKSNLHHAMQILNAKHETTL
jgi:hypothetical protein